jgi:hypothetical protein
MKNKIIISLLIAVFVSQVVGPSSARAQFLFPGTLVVDVATNLNTSLTAAATTATAAAVTASAAAELAGKATQTGFLLSGLNNPLDAGARAGTDIAGSACTGIETAEKIAATADSFGDFTAVGGSPVESVKLTAKIAALESVRTCRVANKEALLKLPSLSVVGATEVAKRQNDLSAEISALGIRIDNLTARKNASIKEVLKAVLVRIVLNLNKSLTTELVNNMVDKYRIEDYLAYGDAVATQVYSAKFINENYKGDARNQMMIRAALLSEKLPSQAKVVAAFANQKAEEYLGEECGSVNGTAAAVSSQDDPAKFARCLAAYGNAQANPAYHKSQADDQAAVVKAAAKSAAQNELDSSNGFAPARNCSGAVSQQQQIDAQYEKAASDYALYARVVNNLEQALEANPPTTTQEEYDKAQNAYAQAKADYEALSASGTGSKIIDICEAISTPGEFVSQRIGDFLTQHLNQASSLQADNLPFYADFISGVASNFLTNIITGRGGSKTQVLKEAGVDALRGSVNVLASGTAQGQAQIKPPVFNGSNTTPSASISVYPAGGQNTDTRSTLEIGKKYVLVGNYTNISKATDVIISGASPEVDREYSIDSLKTGYSFNNFEFEIPFIAQAGTAGDPPIKVINVTFIVKSTEAGKDDQSFGPYSYTYTLGTVKGATTVVGPRGPSVSLRSR